MVHPQWITAIGLAVLLLPLSSGADTSRTVAAGEAAAVAGERPAQRFSGPPDRPRRHFRISNPAKLSAEEAQAIYEGLRPELKRSYRMSGDPTAAGYQAWTRFNLAPYRSMTHGRRYVNNYANDIAGDYGKAEEAGSFPVGAVIAKDSFVVTEDGETELGPLFVMEKMSEGFNYVSGDWRYSLITESGEFAGRTGGPGAERVEFCIACHLAREDHDHLYFVPPRFRVTR